MALGDGPRALGQGSQARVSELLKFTEPCDLHLEFAPAKLYSPHQQKSAIWELIIFC